MVWLRASICLLAAHGLSAQIREHAAGKELPTAAYVRVVSLVDAPVHRFYVKAKDGRETAVAYRKPMGDGPFPLLLFIHGIPGGRSIAQLESWCLGRDGSPVLERFLQEGFVIVAADYRDGPLEKSLQPIPEEGVSPLDDCLAVLNHIRALPFVDSSRVTIYGSSLGGNFAAYMAGRTKVRSIITGGAVLTSLLGAKVPPQTPGADRKQLFHNLPLDPELSKRNVQAIECPVLLLVGGDDFLAEINRRFYALMQQAGKAVRMEFYAGAYHGFETGPGAMAGPGNGKQPLLEGSLDALERAVHFAKDPTAVPLR